LEFTYLEVTTALIKSHGIHEGIWSLTIKFGIGAGNLPAAGTPDGKVSLMPTALVPVLSIGLRKAEEVNDLTVDAAKVNPAMSKIKKKGPNKHGA